VNAFNNLNFEESPEKFGSLILSDEKTLQAEKGADNSRGSSDFKFANQLFREGMYEEAATIYLQLMQGDPDFKYYKINFEKANQLKDKI
jgi:hypothetical protein